MKIKHTALMLAFVLACGTLVTSCSSSNAAQEETLTSREVDFSKIGLKYTTPEGWQSYAKTNNIYPYSYEEDYSIEHIRYNYITPEDWKTIAKSTQSFDLNDYLYPICEIVVVPTENVSSLTSSKLNSTFAKKDLIAENNGVSYYMLSDYNGSIRNLDKYVDDYDKICELVQEISDSFVITDFDVDAYVDAKYAEKNTVTFSTETIFDKPIDSSVFGDYDMTLLFVWATYLHPDANNIADLEQAYQYAKSLGNVNLIGVCIDTPQEKLDDSDEAHKTLETAKELITDSGTTFDMMRLDTNLADFIKAKFKNLPAFVMVDKNGVVRGGYHEGLYTGDQYEKFIDSMVEKYVTNAATQSTDGIDTKTQS